MVSCPQAVLVDRQPPALVRRVLDAVCGACAEAAAGGRPGRAGSAAAARGSSPKAKASSGRGVHTPVVDMQVMTKSLPSRLWSVLGFLHHRLLKQGPCLGIIRTT